jgi:hypothetical protein
MAWSVHSTGLEADHTHAYDMVDTPQQNSDRQFNWAASTGVQLSPARVPYASYPSASYQVSNGSEAAVPEMHLKGSRLSPAMPPCFLHSNENEAPWKQFQVPLYGNLGSSSSARQANQNEDHFATMNNSIHREPFCLDSSLRVPSDGTNKAANHTWDSPDIQLTQKNGQTSA